jgi:hypothetical protein
MPILATRGAGAAKGFGLTAGAAPLICATGGTITYDGDYAIHTFTGPGTFTVNKIKASVPAPEQVVDYLVIGGAGGAPGGRSGGSGAGGYRESKQPTATWTASPLAVSTGIPISGLGSFPISVGAGGTPGAGPPYVGEQGSPTTFSTITGTGGGGSGQYPNGPGRPGGSGGGGGAEGGSFQGSGGGGSGNAGSFSPPEGNPGAPGNNQFTGDFSGSGGGGGGAAAAGGPAPSGGIAGNGGIGAATNISPTGGTVGPTPGIRYWAGGAGGATFGQYTPGQGGAGGGAGQYPAPLGGPFSEGLANTGGGSQGGNGGSGVVVIKYKVK